MSGTGAAASVVALFLFASCTPTLVAIDAHVERDAVVIDDAWSEPDADLPRCSSGMMWNEHLATSEEMFPGRRCVQCHNDENSASGEGDAPIFGAAGTVYPSGHEPDDCISPNAGGAIVTLTDSTGARYALTVNATGNFMVEDPAFRAPYIAEITFEGRTRSMVTVQTAADCNSCHTETGDHDAPGRITLP